jgi:thiol-disulfide isomerase/thioredoxin
MSSQTSRPLARRAWLAGVGVLATVGGAAWYARRADAPPSPAPPDLWSRRFARPEGGELVLAELRDRPLLINFWATWCPPCVKELPEIDRFAARQTQRLRVIGLAIDSLAPVQEFLKRQPVSFPIGLAGFDGTDLSRSLGNTAGGLPFTVLLDARGAVVQRKIGQTHYDELQGWVQGLR